MRETSGNGKQPPPPSHLSEGAAEIWREVLEAYPLHGQAHLPILTKGLEAWDRAESCRQRIDEEGLTWKSPTSGAIHKHPLLPAEESARREFRQCWLQLNLEAGDGEAAG